MKPGSASPPIRVIERVRKLMSGPDKECWPCFNDLDKDGYARFSWKKGGQIFKVGAHRIAYFIANGPFPNKYTVDHTCFTVNCINPSHLRLLSRKDNSSHPNRRFKTHCPAGHEYTKENTYVTRNNKRQCRSCDWVRKVLRKEVV